MPYYDITLKCQSKKLMKVFTTGLNRSGGIIHDSYERMYFNGSQRWRNPIIFKVSFPTAQDRYGFISFTRIWAARPSKLSFDLVPRYPYSRPLGFKLMEPPTNPRRTINIVDGQFWIKDFGFPFEGLEFYQAIEGERNVTDFLDGDMDLVFKKRQE